MEIYSDSHGVAKRARIPNVMMSKERSVVYYAWPPLLLKMRIAAMTQI